MNETETLTPPPRLRGAPGAVPVGADDAAKVVATAIDRLITGRAIPFLGPGVLAMDDAAAVVPTSPEGVAAELNRFTAAPGRIRTNMWSVAQYIEQRRHRRTLVANMAEIFRAPVPPTALHRVLGRLPRLSLIVDTWYDGAMRTALQDRGDWVELQGVTRALETFDVWWRPYGPDGREVAPSEIEAARLVLYKPHGAATPASNFLIADSDYVEVLTEIDIQSPIPAAVIDRRVGRSFVFLGCRFDDQMLRTYARQIAKRAGGPHVALVADPDALSRNERRFFAEQMIVPVQADLGAFTRRLEEALAAAG